MSHTEPQLLAQIIVLKRALLDQQVENHKLKSKILELEESQKNTAQLNGLMTMDKCAYKDRLKNLASLISYFWAQRHPQSVSESEFVKAFTSSILPPQQHDLNMAQGDGLLYALFYYNLAFVSTFGSKEHPKSSDCIDLSIFSTYQRVSKLKTIRMCLGRHIPLAKTCFIPPNLTNALNLITDDIMTLLSNVEDNSFLQEQDFEDDVCRMLQSRSIDLFAKLHNKVNLLQTFWVIFSNTLQVVELGLEIPTIVSSSSGSFWECCMKGINWELLGNAPEIPLLLSIWTRLNGHTRMVSYHLIPRHTVSPQPPQQGCDGERTPILPSTTLAQTEPVKAVLPDIPGDDISPHSLPKSSPTAPQIDDASPTPKLGIFQEMPLTTVRIQQLSAALESLHSRLTN
ncbi:hypothetical protein BASA83_002854 [Batrachochytrium salamandrivorans]|nr:hypothetical protein BASA83_002854 [Batrachochytrium salamandrivorans]